MTDSLTGSRESETSRVVLPTLTLRGHLIENRDHLNTLTQKSNTNIHTIELESGYREFQFCF